MNNTYTAEGNKIICKSYEQKSQISKENPRKIYRNDG